MKTWNIADRAKWTSKNKQASGTRGKNCGRARCTRTRRRGGSNRVSKSRFLHVNLVASHYRNTQGNCKRFTSKMAAIHAPSTCVTWVVSNQSRKRILAKLFLGSIKHWFLYVRVQSSQSIISTRKTFKVAHGSGQQIATNTINYCNNDIAKLMSSKLWTVANQYKSSLYNTDLLQVMVAELLKS